MNQSINLSIYKYNSQFNATASFPRALDHGTPQSGSIRRIFSIHSSGRCHLYPVTLYVYVHLLCIQSTAALYSRSTTLPAHPPDSISPPQSKPQSPTQSIPSSANRLNPPSRSPHGSRHRAKHRAHRSGQHTDWTS